MRSFARALGVVFLFTAIGSPPLASGEDAPSDSAKVEECPFPEQLAKFKAEAPERFQKALKSQKDSHDKFIKRANLVLRGRVGKKPPGYVQKDNEPEIYSSIFAKQLAFKEFRERVIEQLKTLDALVENRAWIGGDFEVPERVGQFMSKPVLFKVFRVFEKERFAVYQGKSSSTPMVIVEGINTDKLSDGQQLPQMEFPAYVSGTHAEGGVTFLVLKKTPKSWLEDVPSIAEKDAKQIDKWRGELQKVADRLDKELAKK